MITELSLSVLYGVIRESLAKCPHMFAHRFVSVAMERDFQLVFPLVEMSVTIVLLVSWTVTMYAIERDAVQ